MTIHEAAELIRHESLGSGNRTWCDLGCGRGVFTRALADLLGPGGIIFAVDRHRESFQNMPDDYRGVHIFKMVCDFAVDDLTALRCDGVLMANSLHFVEEQAVFLQRLRAVAPRLLVVEYDRNSPSKWEPYPVSFQELQKLATAAGYGTVSKLRTVPSSYGGEMYAAWIEVSKQMEDE
jgi:SAM-dependent methyltransferase